MPPDDVGGSIPVWEERDVGLLASRASRTTPRPSPSATAFSDWVYGLTHSETTRERQDAPKRRRRLCEGKFAHQEVEMFRLWLQGHTRSTVSGSWDLVFADDHLGTGSPFQASCLTVKGEPLKCVPDVVLENYSTREILILERKFTNVSQTDVPEFGWPNLRAQLWCYSWIDEFLDAPAVYLVGQIWCMNRVPVRGGSYPALVRKLARAAPRWRRDDPGFHLPWKRMFELFGGTFNADKARNT